MRKENPVTIGPKDAYDELIRRARELATLASCSAILGWDEQTYMPAGGAAHRGNQMALLAGLQHERATDPRLGELLAIAETSPLTAQSDSVEAANIRELRRTYERRVRLPRALVEELARTTSMAQSEWVAARAASDFARFRPWLEKIILLKREESACLAGRRPTDEAAGPAESPYDPLLDDYEPGARSADLAVLFDALRRELTPMVAAIVDASARREGPGSGVAPDSSTDAAGAILKRSYPCDRQRIFGEAVAAAVGFDFRRGRLDVTAHPFCTGIGPGDCRITTRFDEHEFSDAFFGILHEVGHGLYEQGLDEAHHGTPMGEAVSLGVHESQSRLWENLVGRGLAFWAYWLPMARRIFHEALADVSLKRFHAAVNDVRPSLIRVRADEATYNLHIIVRFELEQDLLAGNLAVGDLPAAWNERYREYLGVTPANDAEGCLQDIHWSAGLVGYFPTYTLGNVYAAQLFAAAEAQLGGLDQAFARGDFGGLLDWLREKIHRHGQRYRAADLVERVTGSRPDHRPLIDGLRRKYAELYGI
jgi:carboxypeptidase Taq